jgi:hypothetical protein
MAADCTGKAGSSTITTRGAASLWHTFLERHGTWSHAILHKVRGGKLAVQGNEPVAGIKTTPIVTCLVLS